MTDAMMPIIRQMLDAEDDAARARILLNAPDLVLVKYAGQFEAACRRARFDDGEAFILARCAAMRAVRDDVGNLPGETALQLKDARYAMAIVVAGGEVATSEGQDR